MINFSHNLFGKNLEEVTHKDLVEFFVEQKLESDTLEFKSFTPQADFDGLMAKILKTICGFLNASGGLLIWGAPTKTVVGNIDYFQGSLTPLPVQRSVDWYINKICSSVSPMPIGIVIKIIQVEQAYIYLFEVQESKYKPHQVGNIYYIRLDGQTKPAPHYIVQALMRQIKYPDLRAAIRLNRFQNNDGEILSKLAISIYNFSQLQNEENLNYILVITGGAKFWRWGTNQYGNEIIFRMKGASLEHRTMQRSLHFGIPYTRSFNLTLPNDFEEIKIMLTFGGRNSPSKTCVYNLSSVNINPANPQLNIVIEKDNELFEAKQTIDEALAFFRNNEVI